MHWTSVNGQCVAICTLKWFHCTFTTGLPWLIVVYEIFSLINRPSYSPVLDCLQTVSLTILYTTKNWTVRRPRKQGYEILWISDLISVMSISGELDFPLCDHHVFTWSPIIFNLSEKQSQFGPHGSTKHHIVHFFYEGGTSSPEQSSCSLPQENTYIHPQN